MVEGFNVLKKVNSVLAPMSPTVEGDKWVKETVQPIRGSGGGTLDR